MSKLFREQRYKKENQTLEKQKAKLKLSQKSEWEEYFTQAKADATEIALQISKTDKEIDSMVYALYELTPEEIAVVEK